MQRRSFLRTSGLVIGSGLVLQQQLMAELFQQPAYKIQMLREDLGIFTEKGGTIAFLLTKDGIVVVDSQFPEQSQHLIDELKKNYETKINDLQKQVDELKSLLISKDKGNTIEQKEITMNP